MRVFVDTSGLLAVLDASDRFHPSASKTWDELLTGSVDLVTTSYVLVECYALVQRRLGTEAVRVLRSDVEPVLEVHWVDSSLHRAGTEALLADGRRRLSLVDCVSFASMRQQSITDVFALDAHFVEQGFRCLPDVSV